LALVNDAIKESFDVANIPDLIGTSQFIKVSIDSNTEIEIACFFIHIDDKGELEDVLREIKTHESNHADCLEKWQKCLETKSIKKTNKEINKLWLQIFIRYDVCSKEEQENAGKCCNLKYVLENKTDVFDFTHQCLNELKTFLEMFK
jgi:histidyl-tRNA synthetase